MKDAYLRVVEAWLDQWNARLNESQARIDGVKEGMALLDPPAKANYEAHLAALQEKIDHARQKLAEGRSKVESLRQTTEAAWNDAQTGTWETFKAGAEATWDELTKALDQATAKPEPPVDRPAPANLESGSKPKGGVA